MKVIREIPTRVERIPIVSTLLAAGPNDRVFDSLLLIGPLLIVVIAAVGRSVLTSLLAAAYLVSFVGYTVAKAVESE